MILKISFNYNYFSYSDSDSNSDNLNNDRFMKIYENIAKSFHLIILYYISKQFSKKILNFPNIKILF